MQDETPQLEDGYTRLANELFDAILAFPFSGRQLKVLMTVIRKTYGYNKKSDDMSASQISNVCGMARPHVVKTLGELAEMRVIHKQSGKFGSVVEINKRYGEWGSTESVSPSTKSVSRGTETVLAEEAKTGSYPSTELVSRDTESVQVASTESVHTKDNLPKDKKHMGECANPEFEEAWRLYPKRDGGNSKVDAMKAWNSRIKSGVSAAELLAGVKGYAAYCKDKNMIGTRFVKQAATFFGPGAHYAEPWGKAVESESWWVNAGFKNQWDAMNAGCTRVSAYLWRDGQKAEA